MVRSQVQGMTRSDVLDTFASRGADVESAVEGQP